MTSTILKSKKRMLLFIELLFLLALPILNLNILYILLVLIITLTTKYLIKEKFTDYGFYKPVTRLVLVAIAIGILYGLVDNIYIEPLISKITQKEVDLGDYAKVKGNLLGYIGLLSLGWVVGGLFEEYFFRGYLFNRIRQFIKNPFIYKFTAIALTSIVFAFAHNYQGITGILGTFLFSLIIGIFYFQFQKNIWYLVLIHGFYDSVGITMLYLGY